MAAGVPAEVGTGADNGSIAGEGAQVVPHCHNTPEEMRKAVAIMTEYA